MFCLFLYSLITRFAIYHILIIIPIKFSNNENLKDPDNHSTSNRPLPLRLLSPRSPKSRLRFFRGNPVTMRIKGLLLAPHLFLNPKIPKISLK